MTCHGLTHYWSYSFAGEAEPFICDCGRAKLDSKGNVTANEDFKANKERQA